MEVRKEQIFIQYVDLDAVLLMLISYAARAKTGILWV